MQNIIDKMDKVFDSRIRIAIMALLSEGQWVDFNTLKKKLGVTDGNLASHTSLLERNNMIDVKKQFINKRPNTSYKISAQGKISFNTYIGALKQLLKLK